MFNSSQHVRSLCTFLGLASKNERTNQMLLDAVNMLRVYVGLVIRLIALATSIETVLSLALS